MNKTILLIPMLLVAFSGCGYRQASPQSFLDMHGIAPASAGNMTVCSGFGCTRLEKVHLSSQQLLHLDAMFTPRPSDAQAEREMIARAVAWLEGEVGPLAGTGGDLAKNRRDKAPSGQLDCIAETANTTVYLLLLQDRGLLAHHQVAPPEHRGSTVFTAHNTAVVIDGAGREFAIDSWFHANGALPEVVELSVWRDGFDPGDKQTLPTAVERRETTEENHGV